MPLTLEQNGAMCLIRLAGEVTIVQAAEFKQLLVQSLKEGKDLRLDLEAATELDIPILQLLWAADREAKKLGVGFTATGRIPEEITLAAVEAGFERFPVPLEAS